jgi:hypothetical protein
MKELEALGLSVDRTNYELVYTAPFSERIEFLTDRYPVLNRIYEQFNADRPADFAGRSVSVSDVVVLQWGGEVSAHFVDSAGFVELPSFTGNEREKPQTLYQVETRSPTVAELESDVKAGKSISQSDLSRALSAERQKPVGKGKPSLLTELEETKKLLAKGGQPSVNKNNDLEV